MNTHISWMKSTYWKFRELRVDIALHPRAFAVAYVVAKFLVRVLAGRF